MDEVPQFMSSLLAAVPEFTATYEEHLVEYGGLLPHVLMGDFTRWFIELFRQSLRDSTDSAQARHQLYEVSRLLDAAWDQSSPKVRELIAASFLENLHQARDDYRGVTGILGPQLTRKLAQIE